MNSHTTDLQSAFTQLEFPTEPRHAIAALASSIGVMIARVGLTHAAVEDLRTSVDSMIRSLSTVRLAEGKMTEAERDAVLRLSVGAGALHGAIDDFLRQIPEGLSKIDSAVSTMNARMANPPGEKP